MILHSSTPREGPLRICLFGASDSTTNLGVSALFRSTLTALFRREPGLDLTVFDFGSGVRRSSIEIDQRVREFTAIGNRLSMRAYRHDSLWNMRAVSFIGARFHPALRRIAEADAVMDITGGDSFTDIYGERRFRAALARKLIPLRLGTPVILLPQTYGPFRSDNHRKRARKVLSRVALAYARDEFSLQTIRDVVGTEFDPLRYRLGVDVAFTLEAEDATSKLPQHLVAKLEEGSEARVGINVSGLIWNGDKAATTTRMTDQYRRIVRRLIESILNQSKARVFLIPHVLASTGSTESDWEVSRCVRGMLPEGTRRRVLLVPPILSETETKWVIGKMSWFCGTRLHSTIAALSQGIPTANLAYSMKAAGVFKSLDREDWVVTLGKLHESEILDRLVQSYRTNARDRKDLESVVTMVRNRVHAEWDEILVFVRTGRMSTEPQEVG